MGDIEMHTITNATKTDIDADKIDIRNIGEYRDADRDTERYIERCGRWK